MKRNTERGSLAVEAAIFLPIMIIAVLTVGWLIRANGIIESATHVLADETSLASATASVPVSAVTFKSRVTSRIAGDSGKDVSNVSVNAYKYRIPWIDAKTGTAHTDLIGASVAIEAPIALPKIFASVMNCNTTVLGRAFTGKDNKSEVLPFSKMEEDDGSPLVWVFPRAGERYHAENCRVIKTNAREVLLSGSVRSSYTACKLCKPSSLPNGSLVYVFSSDAKAYHKGSCYLVDRYVISMSKSDAERQGYTKCKICGGG